MVVGTRETVKDELAEMDVDTLESAFQGMAS